MKKERKSGILIALMCLFLPCTVTVIMQGKRVCMMSRDISMEEYVPVVAASQISWDSPKEAIKAQVVAARTNLYLKWQEGEEDGMLQKAAESMKKKVMSDKMLQKFQVFQEAAWQTQGEILKWKENAAEVPYHALSSGRTREGKKILGENFGYISSVETSKDRNSPLYVKGCYFSFRDLEKKIRKTYGGFVLRDGENVEILSTDEAGYVMEIQVGSQVFQGEQLKEILELPSSCFTVQKQERKIRFLCRGMGHGMGISQYTAQQMALEGKTYREILEYFFPEMKLGEY